MARLLIYACRLGVMSSRRIERATCEDVAFRCLAADQHPDHGTVAGFRREHPASLAGLFAQALELCQRAGLVKPGQVAIDGTKMKANAGKHKAMSYERNGGGKEEVRAGSESAFSGGGGGEREGGSEQGQTSPKFGKMAAAARRGQREYFVSSCFVVVCHCSIGGAPERRKNAARSARRASSCLRCRASSMRLRVSPGSSSRS